MDWLTLIRGRPSAHRVDWPCARLLHCVACHVVDSKPTVRTPVARHASAALVLTAAHLILLCLPLTAPLCVLPAACTLALVSCIVWLHLRFAADRTCVLPAACTLALVSCIVWLHLRFAADRTCVLPAACRAGLLTVFTHRWLAPCCLRARRRGSQNRVVVCSRPLVRARRRTRRRWRVRVRSAAPNRDAVSSSVIASEVAIARASLRVLSVVITFSRRCPPR